MIGRTQNNRAVPGTGRSIGWMLLAGLLAAIFMAAPSSPADSAELERQARFSAHTLLEPDILKGRHHTVNDPVDNDGLFNRYTVTSDFGAFTATSTGSLKRLVHEFGAIAAMQQVETDDVALGALKQSGKNTVTGLKNLVIHPQDTITGAAQGVGSLFNRAAGTIGQRETTDAEDSKLQQVIGFSKSKGQIATRYGVNLYSRNAVLQDELDRLATADYLGGLSVGVATSAISGGAGLVLSVSGTARLLNEVINTTPAAELWLQNKRKLLAMGLDEDTVELYLNNPVYSPALQTTMTAALEAMNGVANRGLFVKVGLQAGDPDMARVITEITVMTAGYHKNVAPLTRVAPLARIAHGLKKDGTAVVLLPTDHILWNARVANVAGALTQTARRDKRPGIEIWVLGDLSEMARAQLKAMGWQVHIHAQDRLLPGK